MSPERSRFPDSITRLTSLSLLTALSLALFAAESVLPAPVPLPGVKLGLANIVTLLALCFFSPGEVFWMLTVRILLSGLFAGQLFGLIYSFCGGFAAFLVMAIVRRFLTGRFLFLTSICGALAHNTGQLFAAALLFGSFSVFAYLPVLVLSGCITGLFTGLCARFSQKYLNPWLSRFLQK